MEKYLKKCSKPPTSKNDGFPTSMFVFMPIHHWTNHQMENDQIGYALKFDD